VSRLNAAKSMIPCVLELGGKGAGIVYADADLDAVAHSAGIGIFVYGGQVCSAGSRLIVHRSVEQALTKKLVEWVGKRTMGPGVDDHFFTPLISRAQRDKAEQFCATAVAPAPTRSSVDVIPSSSKATTWSRRSFRMSGPTLRSRKRKCSAPS
jgi:acyl-CoA reductase-like NAD-dependent aldehyde dehydrogenase